MGKINDTLKQASRALVRPIEKFHNSGIVKAVDRFMYKPVRRIPASVAASVGLNLAGGAGAVGVLLGRGETTVQKVWDALTAIPRGIVNSVDHYIHAPEYARRADATLQYLREQGPEVATELGRSGNLLQSGTRQAERGMNLLREAQDYLIPGGDEGFDLQNAYYSLRDGIHQLDAAVESIQAGKDQAVETVGPAIDALKQVDINPVLQALHNLADNLATDEIGYTLGVAAASVLGASAASTYLGGYWGRRGRPGIISRFIQRRGLKRFSNYFKDNPEKIAGEEGLGIFEEHLIQNPGKLEELAQRAGYDISKKS